MCINDILYEVKCNKQWENWRQTSHGSVRAVATTNSMVLITFFCHWFILLFDINTFEKRIGLMPLEKQKYSFFSILFLQIKSQNSWWFEIIQTSTNLHFHVNQLNKVLLVPYPPISKSKRVCGMIWIIRWAEVNFSIPKRKEFVMCDYWWSNIPFVSHVCLLSGDTY